MNHASLFSGIGGFDLAAEWMGWNNILHCELNPFGRRVLHHYWPDATSYSDIKTTDFTKHHGTIDILTGGFPCQPYSSAGKRLGKEDDRHLWPEMLRAIREISPCWVVGENVRGLTNWNGGMVFDEVQADLEAEGYEVLPFLLPACAVNAPHRRDRIWFIAHAAGIPYTNGTRNAEYRTQEIQKGGLNESFFTTNTSNEGLQGSEIHRGIGECREKRGQQSAGRISSDWQNFPTVAPVCSGDDGIPRGLAGITFPAWRNESIKGYGNAIVPQVVYQIFQAIEQYKKAPDFRG